MKDTPEYRDALKALHTAVSLNATLRRVILQTLQEFIQQATPLDRDRPDEYMEAKIEDWLQRGGHGDPGFLLGHVLRGYKALEPYPSAIQQAVIDDLGDQAANSAYCENALAAMEEPVQAFYASLDDRTKFAIGVLVELYFLGHTSVSYGRQILESDLWDRDFLDRKSAGIENDPALSVLVRAHRFARGIYPKIS